MLNIGGPELMIILLVALVFLGPQRLPEVARQLGQAVSSLRSLASGFQAELEAASRPEPDKSMTLDGPTDTAEAIKSTQDDPFHGRFSDPFELVKTDPLALKEQAREVSQTNPDAKAEKPVSAGGPTDQRDVANRDATAQGGDEEE